MSKLLQEKIGDDISAWTGGELDNDWARAHCFLRAADGLAEQAMKTPGLKGVYAAPILHLLRHSIELELKRLIVEAEQVFDIMEPFGWTKGPPHQKRVAQNLVGHFLVQLVDLLQDRTRAIWNEDLDPDLVSAIKEIDQIDPRGEAFRYTSKRDGSPTLQDELRFDLAHLRENIRKLRERFIDLETRLSCERREAMEYISYCEP
jgi:hypothetical protein